MHRSLRGVGPRGPRLSRPKNAPLAPQSRVRVGSGSELQRRWRIADDAETSSLVVNRCSSVAGNDEHSELQRRSPPVIHLPLKCIDPARASVGARADGWLVLRQLATTRVRRRGLCGSPARDHDYGVGSCTGYIFLATQCVTDRVPRRKDAVVAAVVPHQCLFIGCAVPSFHLTGDGF